MLNLAVQMFQGTEIGDSANLIVEGYEDCTVDGTLVVGNGQIAITSENIDYWLEVGL